MAKENLSELLNILKLAEDQMAMLEKGEAPVDLVLKKVQSLLVKFHVTAAQLGVKGLVQVGQKMEVFARQTSMNAEDLTTLAFALGFLRGGIKDGSSEAIRSSIIETLEILGVDPSDISVPYDDPKAPKKPAKDKWLVDQIATPPAREPEPAPPEPDMDLDLEAFLAEEMGQAAVDEALRAFEVPDALPDQPPVSGNSITKLDQAVVQWGGRLVPSSADSASFMLEFPSASLEKVKFLLAPYDPEDNFTKELGAENQRAEQILKTVKEFMASFAEGNLERAQEVLEELAGVQDGDELFSEIGTLARDLHGSLKNLSSTIDPDLTNLLEEKIPDSGNRLEHILQMTEEAATTTLDHAESIHAKLKENQQNLVRLERHIHMLKPIGDMAYGRMSESVKIMKDLRGAIDSIEEDLSIILTSQGYQDLTGQVISKIVAFQKDMESKLVSIVKAFGMKVGKNKSGEKGKEKELYGPAHAKTEGAVASQDEVDDILAQFGF